MCPPVLPVPHSRSCPRRPGWLFVHKASHSSFKGTSEALVVYSRPFKVLCGLHRPLHTLHDTVRCRASRAKGLVLFSGFLARKAEKGNQVFPWALWMTLGLCTSLKMHSSSGLVSSRSAKRRSLSGSPFRAHRASFRAYIDDDRAGRHIAHPERCKSWPTRQHPRPFRYAVHNISRCAQRSC